MIQFYVYIYFDGDIAFYVGKGHGRRAYKHLERKGRSHFIQKIQKLIREGNDPDITIIAMRNESEALEFEKLLIAEIGRQDLGKGPLLNQTDGGDGASGVLVGPKTRAKHSANMKRPEHRAKLNTALKKPETGAKISAGKKGKSQTAIHRAKRAAAMSIAMKGNKNSLAREVSSVTRAKIGAANSIALKGNTNRRKSS